MTEERPEKVIRQNDLEKLERSFKGSNDIRPSTPLQQGNGAGSSNNGNQEKQNG